MGANSVASAWTAIDCRATFGINSLCCCCCPVACQARLLLFPDEWLSLLLAAAGMYGFFFVDGEVKNFEQAAKQDTAKFGRWHRGMLERGIYLAPSAYEAGFTSLAHTEEDIDKTIAAAREVMQSL